MIQLYYIFSSLLPNSIHNGFVHGSVLAKSFDLQHLLRVFVQSVIELELSWVALYLSYKKVIKHNWFIYKKLILISDFFGLSTFLFTSSATKSSSETLSNSFCFIAMKDFMLITAMVIKNQKNIVSFPILFIVLSEQNKMMYNQFDLHRLKWLNTTISKSPYC